MKTKNYYQTKARNKAIHRNLARRVESVSDGLNDFERRAIKDAAEEKKANDIASESVASVIRCERLI